MNLLHNTEVHAELCSVTRSPVHLVTHHQNVWLQFAEPGSFHQRFSTVLKICIVDQCVKTLQLMAVKPIASFLVKYVADSMSARRLQKKQEKIILSCEGGF